MRKNEALAALAQVGIMGADVAEHTGALHFFANDARGCSEWRCYAMLDEETGGLVEYWGTTGRSLPAYDTLAELLEAL